MSALDSRIDELYQGPLESFTASRNALAKTLNGEEKKRVSALAKPLAIPWIVNQTYWHARRTYDALLAAGKDLRGAQVSGLQGRATDIRAASDRHAKALVNVMAEAMKVATAAGLQPQTDALRRMLEAVSTRQSLPAEHGRFVKPLEPAGFEALSGLSIAAPLRPVERVSDKPAAKRPHDSGTRGPSAEELKAARKEEQRQERERAEGERKRQLAIVKAKAKVTAAARAENRARFGWERAKKSVEAAERALDDLLSSDE